MAPDSSQWSPARRWVPISLDDLPPDYPGKRVSWCTCGTWDHIHEPNCGWDIDDEER